jgi:hypothetical protein
MSAYSLDHHLAELSSYVVHDSEFPASTHSIFAASDVLLLTNTLNDSC